MPSGLRKTSGNQFEIYYEQPWGGVASNVDPVDLQPNQLVIQQGVLISDGVLAYLNCVADPVRFGFVPAVTADAFPFVIWEMVGELFACDQYGYIYLYNNTANPNIIPAEFEPFQAGFPIPSDVVASDGPWNVGSGGNQPTAVQVINGKAYIAVFSRNTIYVFDPAAGTFTVASTFAGGLIMGVLSDYLLQLNTNNATDGLQSNRINWSGPGKFSTWDPSIDRTAGFNTLASVEDQITGFLSYASVGIAITQKGLVELSPTGVAISPFNFTELWTSDIGQGCIYPLTVSQYGQKGFFLTDSSAYSASVGAGFNDISPITRKAIFTSLQPANYNGPNDVLPLVSGAVCLYAYNSEYATPCYILCGIPVNSPNILVVWIMDLLTGVWQEFIYNVNALYNKQHGTSVVNATVDFINIATFDVAPRTIVVGTAPGSFTNAVTLITLQVTSSDGVKPVILTPYIFNRDNVDSTSNYIGSLNLVFRAEEIKLWRQPTIRRILVKAYGSGMLALSINGTSFGTITLDGTTNTKTYLAAGGVYTGEAPQLTITSNTFKGVIVKIMLAGTYADGDVD